MRQQSSRAEITPWSFDNEYHFGDFRGDALTMLRRGYDMHLHYANFGIRKLLIRLPHNLPIDNDGHSAANILPGLFEERAGRRWAHHKRDDRLTCLLIVGCPGVRSFDCDRLSECSRERRAGKDVD